MHGFHPSRSGNFSTGGRTSACCKAERYPTPASPVAGPPLFMACGCAPFPIDHCGSIQGPRNKTTHRDCNPNSTLKLLRDFHSTIHQGSSSHSRSPRPATSKSQNRSRCLSCDSLSVSLKSRIKVFTAADTMCRAFPPRTKQHLWHVTLTVRRGPQRGTCLAETLPLLVIDSRS